MNAESIFITASIMVLANGAILAAMCRERPATLRPAAAQWCLGTLLIALGCTVFAFGTPLPRPIMLGAANAAFAFGLTAYRVAIRHFLRLEVKARRFLPAVLATCPSYGSPPSRKASTSVWPWSPSRGHG